MKIQLASFIVVLLSSVAPAYAHRLDEYLQATTIAVQKDRFEFHLRMTPGVEVARKLLARIDTDGDGSIADDERNAYVDWVLRDISAALDGRTLRLRPVSSSFPKAEDMTKGLGSILIEFEADMPPGGPTRLLTLENRHQDAIAIYLVNCTQPHNWDIHIIAQYRNYTQSSYRMNFLVGGPSSESYAAPSWLRRWLDQTVAPSLLITHFFHGVHHILAGYDHLLFITVLVLGASTLWDLVKVVTAFTLAHSITLTLAALNFIHLPEVIVEPLIAASIVFVAVQNLFWPASTEGRSRLIVAFFFGLFHGLGFAGGLLGVMQDLPRGAVVLAILGFCTGVEAGHQMVLLPLFGLLKAARRLRRDTPERANLSMKLQRVGSAGVLLAGIYYVCVSLIGNY